MTATAPAARQTEPGSPGPHRAERSVRFLGLGVILRLAAGEVRERRTTAAVAAVAGLGCGFGIAGAFDAVIGHRAWPVASIALLAGGAALADATDPGRREDAALLVRLGCPRFVVRAGGWTAAVAMLAMPAALAAASSDLTGTSPRGRTGGWAAALLLVGAGAATTAGARLPSTRGDHASGPRVRFALRAAVGLSCILLGALVPGLSKTGSDLDLALPMGTVLVVAGLVVGAPLIVGAAAAVAGGTRRPVGEVAAHSLREQRRGLTISVAVVATVTTVFLVHTVVGQGLGARERDRTAALAARGPTSIGGGERLLLVDALAFGPFSVASQGSGRLDQREVLAAAGAGAVGAPIDELQTRALPDGARYGHLAQPLGLFGETTGGTTARATPQLLAALGLDPSLAAGDDALVLDDRVLDPDGLVLLVGPQTSPPTNRRPQGVAVPGIDAVPGARWTGLPSVLLPSGLVDRPDGPIPGALSAGTSPTAMVVRFPQRPTAAQVDAVSRAAGVAAVAGDEDSDASSSGRTDGVTSIVVRTTSDARVLALALAAIVLVALVVALAALRLAVRRDDAVLVELGARRRTLVAVAAVRAATVTAGGVAAGAVIGLTATAFGLWRYDTGARLADEVVLAPIGWHVPPGTWLGLALVPVAAAGVGAALEVVAPGGRRCGREAFDR